jgi:hypothetical protein
MDTPENPAGPKQRKFVRVIHRALALAIAAPLIIIALGFVAFGINRSWTIELVEPLRKYEWVAQSYRLLSCLANLTVCARVDQIYGGEAMVTTAARTTAGA